MYDVKQLEEEWKRYRKKKLRPWYIGGLVFLLFIPIVFFFSNKQINFSMLNSYINKSEHSVGYEEKPENISDTIVNKEKKSILLNSALSKLEIKDHRMNETEKVVQKSPNILVDIPLLEDSEEFSVEEVSEQRNKIHLEIIESTNVKAYKDVEKRFFESQDIDDALFLAESYFKNGNYKKAEFWALQTNKLDEYNEVSLLIFVKSKLKLGHKNEALNILMAYIKKTNSQEAKKLLYLIENDKL